MKRREWLVIGGLFVVLFAVRLFLSAGEFTPDAYFHIRMVEHIAQTGVPMTYDPLSYGGRALQFSPLFHYLLAVFSWVIPLDIVVHVLPQLFVSLLSLLIYIIVKKITENTSASSFSAVLAAVIPAFFAETLFSVSPLTLALPLDSIYHLQKIISYDGICTISATKYSCCASCRSVLVVIGRVSADWYSSFDRGHPLHVQVSPPNEE